MAEGRQETPANLSVPLAAKPLERSSWSWESRFTQKNPARCICGHARDVLAGQNSTSGGSSDTLVNDWQVIPTGRSPDIEVTTVTPVQNRPSTSRNRRELSALTEPSSGTGTGWSAPNSKSNWPRNESMSSWLGQDSRASEDIPPGISLVADTEVMPPVADRRALSRDPALVVDRHALGAHQPGAQHQTGTTDHVRRGVHPVNAT